MKIRHVECEQFAGLINKELDLDSGLNLVVGDNESGKSTIVDLIYFLLFQDTKLDGRSDSGFIDKYFPKKVTGPDGDVIGGTLVFETPSGTYELAKEWEQKNGSCKLKVPSGTTIKGKEQIRETLEKELKYRAGVYNEIVFASQKSKQTAIESIMKSLEKAKKEEKDRLLSTRENLTSTLTQAVQETGGVSLDKIEKTLREKMDALIDKWDLNADAPEGGAQRASYDKKPWKNGAGSIVKAYYEVDEVRSRQASAEQAEREVESENAKIQNLQERKKEVGAKREAFKKYHAVIGQRSLLEASIKDSMEKINERKEALERWPGFNSDINRAKELGIMQKQAKDHELFLRAEPVYKDLQEKKAEFEKLKKVEPFDLKNLGKLISEKQSEENKLAGMNLAAKIRKLGSSEIIVTSAASGDVLDISDGELKIEEAVHIVIPDVMEMDLMPEGVDVEAVKNTLVSFEEKIKALHEKYGVSSFDELQLLSESYSEKQNAVSMQESKLEKILGDRSWEGIVAANELVPEGIETEAEIKSQIDNLCGSRSIDAFVGGLESTLSEYETRYENIEKLQESISTLIKKQKAQQEELDSLDEIPEEFQGIEDANQYDEELQNSINDFEEQIQESYARLNDAVRNLGDKSAEEYSEERQDKEAALETLKAEYGHWENIYNTFCRLKEQSSGNPVAEIEEGFRKYLGLITDGNLQLNSMDEQMAVQLASGSNALTFDTLSDGTKDTLSLAFRLAMLEHLYPDGNGFAVFDDPFTDMDAKRVEQSCKLVQKFAENNQVIFITCDEKYKNYLTGKVIPIGR